MEKEASLQLDLAQVPRKAIALDVYPEEGRRLKEV
jgi:hypothetical protein